MRKSGVVLMLAAAMIVFAARAAEPEWKQLFNGKDLTGWKTHPKNPGKWRVEEGVLVSSGKESSHLFSERDDFEKRFKAGHPISVSELLYPLMQAYDSVAIQADVELGGTDQLYNLLAGREVMEHYGLEPQIVLTTPLLVSWDGTKMSSSVGNNIPLTAAPEEQFGRTMRIPDTMLEDWFRLVVNAGTVSTRLGLGGWPRIAEEMIAKPARSSAFETAASSSSSASTSASSRLVHPTRRAAARCRSVTWFSACTHARVAGASRSSSGR